MAKIFSKEIHVRVKLYGERWKHVDIAYETDGYITRSEVHNFWERYCPRISKETKEVWHDELFVGISDVDNIDGKIIKRISILSCFTGDYLSETKDFRRAFEKYIMERPE